MAHQPSRGSEVFTAACKQEPVVFDTIKEDGKETKILNKEETELQNGKIQGPTHRL